MQRRDFITLLGGAAAACPLVVQAQQKTRIYRIAALLGGSTANAGEIGAIEKFFKGFGWSPGRDLEITYRWGAGDTELNKAYAKEIIGMKPDAILAMTFRNGCSAPGSFANSDRVCYGQRSGWNALR
jgi:putative ABC transport system substrate-binding protein